MTKIDIFSGFLGAGKTTLIKKLIKESFGGEKVMLIENEFGEIGVDGGFLQDAGIEITEMNSGCICCSLVGDFGRALTKALTDYHPDRILIEPSGVGKLSDVIRAVQRVGSDEMILSGFVTIVDAAKCRMHMKNFGEFFNDQIANAGTIVLSHTGKMTEEKLLATVDLLREHNPTAMVVTTDWDALTGDQLLEAIERTDTLKAELERLKEAEHEHHHDDEDEDCCCHHHHHDDEDEDEHEHHHHHHHDEDEEEHEHHHHHHHDDEEHDHEECGCHHHHHDEDEEGHEHHHHHHHHHADEVFVSYGVETAKKFDRAEIENALSALTDADRFGMVLRAKGIVAAKDGSWIHFDYVPGEPDVRSGSAAVIGRLCVIGSKLNREALSALLGVTLE